MKKTIWFKFMAAVTYVPLPLLGFMLIFLVMGKLLHVGWLESAPDVLLIPTLVCYYLSLIVGAIYGYLKKEEAVYLPSLVAIGIWIVGFALAEFLTLSRDVMIAINIVLLTMVTILHIAQYRATKKWDNRYPPVREQ